MLENAVTAIWIAAGMPMRTIFPSISQLIFRCHSVSRMQDSLRMSVMRIKTADTPCAMIVAYATPRTPMLN